MKDIQKSGIRTPCNYVGVYLPGRRGYVDAQSEDKCFYSLLGSFVTSKTVLSGRIVPSSSSHMENGIRTPRSLMWDSRGFWDTEIYIPSICLRLILTYFATILYLLLSFLFT